ncbi:TIGR04282 family arsenosugar biosynthesis glycosyltransferase [Lichenicola sp.]|uniref:TIGR04282 family arsenosugar biosynthesis glycosyltransferase n=1 Tax=Lichenicola sp. TaxID=2804529 RepID=UPI003B00908F
MIPRLAIFARYPTPGMAKTRLIPAIGADAAARLHRRLVERTVMAARQSGLAFELRATGASIEAFTDWLGGDVALVEQGEGDLGARLARVPAPAIVIGSDAPGLTADLLAEAAAALRMHAAVIGPALDGGYTLLGFREPVPFAFEGMAWSTDTVFAETMHRLRTHGIAPLVLPMLADIDRPEDLLDWPELLA